MQLQVHRALYHLRTRCSAQSRGRDGFPSAAVEIASHTDVSRILVCVLTTNAAARVPRTGRVWVHVGPEPCACPWSSPLGAAEEHDFENMSEKRPSPGKAEISKSLLFNAECTLRAWRASCLNHSDLPGKGYVYAIRVSAGALVEPLDRAGTADQLWRRGRHRLQLAGSRAPVWGSPDRSFFFRYCLGRLLSRASFSDLWGSVLASEGNTESQAHARE